MAPRLTLLAVTGIPLAALWASVLGVGGDAERAVTELRRGEMVRILALFKEGGPGLSLEAAARTTGYGLSRVAGGEARSTTLSDPALLDRVKALSPPPPTFPAIGTLEAGGQTATYAALREGSGGTLVVTLGAEAVSLGGLRMRAALGAGLASLLALGFLLSAHRKPDHLST